MGFRMFDYTLLLARCMVVGGSSIACFVAVVSFSPAVGACSELIHVVVGQRSSANASMRSED